MTLCTCTSRASLRERARRCTITKASAMMLLTVPVQLVSTPRSVGIPVPIDAARRLLVSLLNLCIVHLQPASDWLEKQAFQEVAMARLHLGNCRAWVERTDKQARTRCPHSGQHAHVLKASYCRFMEALVQIG